MEGDAEAKLQLPKWRIQKRAPVRAWTRGWMDGWRCCSRVETTRAAHDKQQQRLVAIGCDE